MNVSVLEPPSCRIKNLYFIVKVKNNLDTHGSVIIKSKFSDIYLILSSKYIGYQYKFAIKKIISFKKFTIKSRNLFLNSKFFKKIFKSDTRLVYKSPDLKKEILAVGNFFFDSFNKYLSFLPCIINKVMYFMPG